MISRSKGFTLLEVMIALAVVAIALVTLLGLSNRSIEVNSRLQRVTRATLLAQGKMAEIEVAGGEEAGEGTFAEPHAGYRWHTDYGDTPLPSVRMVTVTVAWGDEGRGEAVDLTSFLFRGGRP